MSRGVGTAHRFGWTRPPRIAQPEWSEAMPPRASLDEKLAALRALRGRALNAEEQAVLRKKVGDRSNLVVASAAAIVGENGLVELAKDLEEAFERFMVNPIRDDKLCRAKTAIVQALDRMEHQDPGV